MSAPIYIQIKQHIEQKILSGEWPVGQKIPTELELTEQFSVSRMTVNKAIRDLVTDGKVERTPRRGTFVCAPNEKAESPLLDIRNIAEEVQQRGQQYHSEILQHISVQANEHIATQLGIMLDSRVFYSEITHFSDGVPIQLEIRWVNALFAPNYLQQDFTKQTPNQYLSNNCPLSAIEHTVEAIPAEPNIKTILQLNDNEPCLLLNRRTWSGNQLISVAKLYHPASRYKLSSKILL
ncbi:histidine utilization repressor [Vibrio tapetis]|uniref:Histidine utilization repressor n=1 Tax=Vibrio tapetis subsp. tapetis TaxID=1671868 RepID=A0A2N8Z963_9VIBR|nr:histidine utilization repressor [Vibrio tapetis]SON48440.1 Histidine utilization repressor [Vibrio tapetis subsp. tapetis]